MNNSKHSLITAEQAGTLDGLFYERTLRSADDIAYIQYNKKQQAWEESSWNDMATLVGNWQKGIASEKLENGVRIAILMKNSRKWVAADQTALGLGLGLVTVPLYLEDRPDNIAYVLEDAGVKLLFVQDISQWNRLRNNCNDNTILKKIILIDTDAEQLEDEDNRVITLQQWLPEKAYMLHQRNGKADQLATIIYTSGTTGKPKGVMLSHNNILLTIYPTGIALDVRHDDLFLSFLPMSHTFERSLGYYLTTMAGSTVAFARSIQLLANDMVALKPTLLISVPRIYERIYAKIEEALAKSSAIKRGLFKLTIQVGWRHFLYQQNRSSFCLSCLL